MGTYTKNLKLETPNYTDNADIPALTKKNNEIIDSEMIKRANGLDYNEQTGVLQLTGNNFKVGSPIQIKNNLPVTSMASGTELKLNNNKEVIKLSVDGKTEQKSYTGKSLIDYSNSTLRMSTNPLNGVSVTVDDDGIITLNGTSTDSVSFCISEMMTDLLKSNKKYSFFAENLNGAQSNQVNLILYGNDGSKGFNLSQIISTTSGKNVRNITSKQDYKYAYFWLYCVKGVTFNNLKIRLMLVEGDYTIDTIGEFEPYCGGQSSPNPDYPQKIKNVRGVENLLKNTNVNSGDGNYWINYSTFDGETGTLTRSTTATTEAYINHNINNLKSNTTYTLFLEAKSNGYVSTMDLYCFNKNIEGIKSKTKIELSTEFQKFKFTFTTDENVDYSNNSMIRIDNNGSTTDGKEAILTIKNVILAEGSFVNGYVPYGSNYLQLKNISKNILSELEVGNINSSGIPYNDTTSIRSKNFDEVKPNTNYTVSKNGNMIGSNVSEYDNNQSFIRKTYVASGTIVTSSSTKYIKTQLIGNLTDKIQIEEGTKATEYEPYKSQTINIDLKGNELCSDKEQKLKDELIIENGRAKIIKKYDEIVLNGTENFIRHTTSTSNYVYDLEVNNIIKTTIPTEILNIMCSHLKSQSMNSAWTGKTGICATNISSLRFCYVSDNTNTLENWKAFLKSQYDSGNPVKVQYQLTEPKVIDLGEVDLELLENSTLTCDEEPNMQIDYLTIDSNIFVQDSLDVNSSQKAPSVKAVNEALGKINGKILWKNSDSTKPIEIATNITLNSDDYDMYEVFYRTSSASTNTTGISTGKIAKGWSTILQFTYSEDGSNVHIRRRDFNYINDTTYQIGKNVGNDTVSSALIPIYIIGYKTGLFD